MHSTKIKHFTIHIHTEKYKYDQHITKEKISCIHGYEENFDYIVNSQHRNLIHKVSTILKDMCLTAKCQGHRDQNKALAG